MTFRSLASSSKGNVYVVEQDGQALLVDIGLDYKEFKRRLGEFDAEFVGVVITHSHIDHIRGLKVFLKHHAVPVYANAMTADAIVAQTGVDEAAFFCFENGQDFEAGPFKVHPFSIPHDTADPVGYLIRGDATYFHGTDIGTPLASVGLQLAEAELATLESNHDVGMLRHSGRPPMLIQRIAGPRGHLSNAQAAELVRQYASPCLRELYLAHLSQDCNAPEFAEREMRAALTEIGRQDVKLTVLSP